MEIREVRDVVENRQWRFYTELLPGRDSLPPPVSGTSNQPNPLSDICIYI